MREIYIPEGYEALASVMYLALEHAASGKGKERHANGQVFHKQRMITLGRQTGPSGPVYQACKKSLEACNTGNGNDILGAINYLCGAYLIQNFTDEQLQTYFD